MRAFYASVSDPLTHEAAYVVRQRTDFSISGVRIRPAGKPEQRSDETVMRVIQVVPTLDTEASGPSYSVPALTKELKAIGVRSDIFATGKTALADAELFDTQFHNIPVLGRLRFSSELFAGLSQAASRGAILHAHGLWLMPNLYPAWAAKRSQAPVIFSPRGMLAPAALSFSRTKKGIFWKLAQRKALEAAVCFHATSMDEAQDIRAAELRAPIAVIPNGIDIPVQVADDVSASKTVLHLGRLHPKKGTDRLIEAWARLANDFPQWRLRIVGPSERGYVDSLKRQALSKNLTSITFEEPLYGLAKTAMYQCAELFVLPTLNENFGLVVAEALAAGTPVICSKGAPWAGLETERCGWWIDHGVGALERALREAMSLLPEQRSLMGARGREWMMRSYSWQGIARSMLAVYRWVKEEGEAPPCVMLT